MKLIWRPSTRHHNNNRSRRWSSKWAIRGNLSHNSNLYEAIIIGNDMNIIVVVGAMNEARDE